MKSGMHGRRPIASHAGVWSAHAMILQEHLHSVQGYLCIQWARKTATQFNRVAMQRQPCTWCRYSWKRIMLGALRAKRDDCCASVQAQFTGFNALTVTSKKGYWSSLSKLYLLAPNPFIYKHMTECPYLFHVAFFLQLEDKRDIVQMA